MNSTLKNQKLFNQQSLRRWQNGLLQLLQSWLRDLQFNKRAEKKKSSESTTSNNLNRGSFDFSRNRISPSRVRVALAGVVNLQSVAKTFPRIVVGLVCLMVLAPYADIFYTRLDFNDRVSADVWYYESYHWLFLCLGPYLKSLFQTIGLYLVFARGSSILSLIAAYSMMYDAGKILWLLQVVNHEEYKSLPTNWFLVYGFIAGAFIVLIADKLTYWLNHRVEAIKRRLHGITNLVGKVDDKIVLQNFVQTVRDDIKVQQFKQY